MYSIEHLQTLFAYNDWANRRLIVSLRQSNCEPALGHMSHVLIAENEYHARLFGKDSTGFDFWPKLSISEISDLAKENAASYEKLLSRFDDEGLGHSVDYKTSGGNPVTNTFRDILTHVILHSMNHRGQVLTILRQNGFTPPWIDYIIYRRELQ